MSFTEKGVIDYVEKFGKKYENLSDAKNLLEINCLEKKFRYLSLVIYNNKGEVIDSSNYPSEWSFIIPEAMVEGLYKEVCK